MLDPELTTAENIISDLENFDYDGRIRILDFVYKKIINNERQKILEENDV